MSNSIKDLHLDDNGDQGVDDEEDVDDDQLDLGDDQDGAHPLNLPLSPL